MKYDCIISPDAGAEKRSGGVARMLGLPLIHAWKHRNIKDGFLSGFGIEPSIRDYKSALVVDDICDGGGTFAGLSATIKEISPFSKCDLFVTHGLFSKGTKDLLSSFNNIFCTDSMLQALTSKGVNVINICEKLL
jgi:ribose-phosphate pyrophosphokinase